MELCILLSAVRVGVRFMRHLTLTLGIPSMGAVGRLGHFILHAACSSELQAALLTKRGDLHVVVE